MKKIAVVIASVGLLAVAACGKKEEAANNAAAMNVVENASNAMENASNAMENASNAMTNETNATNAM